MDAESVTPETDAAMQKAVDHLLQEFSSVSTGKASPTLVENLDVKVESYGSSMKLQQLAVVNTPEPRLLVISPFDPNIAPDIERAVKESKLGLNPALDGTVIRISIPELSEDRRKDLVKVVKGMAEDARVSVRGARKAGMDAIKKLKGDNDITEDDVTLMEKEVQEVTDKHTKSVDEHLKKKEADIMQV
ncbi:MAG: ribosome recycling factor [Verrucomicrobiota bacterium]